MQYKTKSNPNTFTSQFLNSIASDRDFVESSYFQSVWLSNDEDLYKWVESIPSSYDIYTGYGTLEELVDNFLLPKSRYIIIKFQQQYYAVVYQSSNHQLIMKKEKFTFIENNRIVKSDRHPDNYTINYRRRNLGENRTIYHEMKTLDPNMKIYVYKKSNSSKVVETGKEFSYAVGMLGASFKNYSITLNNLYLLNYYYSMKDILFLKYILRFYHFSSINPFKWLGKKVNHELIKMPSPYMPFCKPFIDQTFKIYQ